MNIARPKSHGKLRLLRSYILSSLLLTSSLFATEFIYANSQVWIIGGGNVLENSQGQIEQNVLWLEHILKGRVDALNIYYASGYGATPDVAFWQARAESTAELQPLARVFARVGLNGKQYKHHEINNVKGSTKKAELLPTLTAEFSQASENDNLLLIYNGHGGLHEDDIRLNYLKLWGDESVTVGELDEVFDHAPDKVSIRFILTQCFSGAFQKLVFDNPASSSLGKQNRCGFLAASAWHEAEGCALEINKEEFRDYSTYFFAALDGKTRLNQALATNPDINQDGKVSYREAHLFTLQTAVSTDLSRSTSEIYLEEWQPWYLRWSTWLDNEASIYWQIANKVALANHLPMDARELWQQQLALKNQLLENEASLESTLKNIHNLQQSIQAATTVRWPELMNPYTLGHFQVLSTQLDNIQNAILAHPNYINLKEEQDSYLALQQNGLNLERRYTQAEKILRLKKLARLEKQFQQYANRKQREQYERLFTCEEGVL